MAKIFLSQAGVFSEGTFDTCRKFIDVKNNVVFFCHGLEILYKAFCLCDLSWLSHSWLSHLPFLPFSLFLDSV